MNPYPFDTYMNPYPFDTYMNPCAVDKYMKPCLKQTRHLPRGAMFPTGEVVPFGYEPIDGALFKLRVADLPGVQKEMGFDRFNTAEMRFIYMKQQGPQFCIADLARFQYSKVHNAKHAIMTGFRPDDPAYQGDGATGKLVLKGVEYPSITKKQVGWNYSTSPQRPVYDYFGPANTLLMYATEYIPGVKVVVMTTFANLMGLNGRAAAAEEARKTLAIAMDPLNETADGYGPEVASVQFQYTQQLQS